MEKRIDASIGEHDFYQSLDGFSYNAVTVLAIFFGGLAAILPESVMAEWLYCVPYSKILIGFSTTLFAVDRSINIGHRWVYHRQMRHSYVMVKDMIALYKEIPDGQTEDKKKMFQELSNALKEARSREAMIPGVNAQQV